MTDNGTIFGILPVYPGQDETAKLFKDFVYAKGKPELYTEEMERRVMRTAFSYMFSNVYAQGQSYRAFVDPKSEPAKEYQRDLVKISRHVAQLIELLDHTKAGHALHDKGSLGNHMWPGIDRSLSALGKSANEALDDLSPPGGRTRSHEREARIRLIYELMRESKLAGAKPGTGDLSPFANMIRKVYEVLKIGTERNLSRDLADALKLLRQNGAFGQLWSLRSNKSAYNK